MATTVTAPRPATAPAPAPASWAGRVRWARRLLQTLLVVLVAAGVLASVLGYQAVRTALDNYYEIVQASAVSADAAQDAREALLIYHSAAADYLTLPEGDARAQSASEAQAAWDRYQEAMRRLWGNRSDETFGEFSVFDAADNASWTYNTQINSMFAFASTGDTERATAAFRDANTTLVQRLVPALSGLENVKLESMEEAYARTSAQIRRWTGSFALAAAVAVAVLLAALALTRLWLHYRWTWQLLLAFLVGALLFGWFSYTLLSAANQVRVLVREAYDTVSGIQSVKALATQADALESLALFDSDQAQATLRDYDQYIFVIEQQLCGERDCSERPFLAPSGPVRRTEIEAVDPAVVEAAREGQSKYGLPRTPLIGNVHFRGEAAALEAVRVGLDQYLDANEDLRAAVLAGDVERATTINQGESATALGAMLEAADDERRLVRAEFNRIWNQVRGRMSVNLWLTLLFAAAAALGAWGISVRRQSLFP